MAFKNKRSEVFKGYYKCVHCTASSEAFKGYYRCVHCTASCEFPGLNIEFYSQ